MDVEEGLLVVLCFTVHAELPICNSGCGRRAVTDALRWCWSGFCQTEAVDPVEPLACSCSCSKVQFRSWIIGLCFHSQVCVCVCMCTLIRVVCMRVCMRVWLIIIVKTSLLHRLSNSSLTERLLFHISFYPRNYLITAAQNPRHTVQVYRFCPEWRVPGNSWEKTVAHCSALDYISSIC